MRYIKQRQVMTTVCDTTLAKKDEVLKLLEKIKSDSSEFILILKKYKNDFCVPDIHTYNQVKIKSINKNFTVDFLVFTKSSVAVLREVNIDEIDTINVIYSAGTSKAGTIETLKKDIVEILKSDEDTSRFGMMDLDGTNTGD